MNNNQHNQPPAQQQQPRQDDEKLTLDARYPVYKDLSIEEQPVFRSLPLGAFQQDPAHSTTFRSILAPNEFSIGGLEPPSFAKIQPMGGKTGPIQFEFNPTAFGFHSPFQPTSLEQALKQQQLQQQQQPIGGAPRQSELAEQLDRILMATVMDMPAYVEKYTSFSSSKLPREIFEKTVKALQNMSNVDFDLNGSLVNVSGTYYDGHVSARFQVNLFKKERGYLVEVQRRCGDCMAFNHFFQALKEELATSGVTEGAQLGHRQAQPQQQPPQQPQQKPVEKPVNRAPPAYDIVLNEVALAPLQSMAESDYVDVAREGMKMLAKCSMTPDNAVLIGSKCLSLLQRRLLSADEELFRYASFILSNITKTGNVCHTICTQAAAVESVFQALQTADNKEIRRLLAQCVANFALINTQAIAHENYRQVLRRHRASSDSRLSTLVEATLARVDL